MFLASEQTYLREWGNSSAFRISKKLLQSLQFDTEAEYMLQAIDENGEKKLVITPVASVEEKIALIESLSGILEGQVDAKEERQRRREERFEKYERLT